MILEVDIGNSRIKWRLRSENTIILSSVSDNTEDPDSIFDLKGIQPTAVWLSTVAPSLQQKISQWCYRRFGIQPQCALVTRERVGVNNGYNVPSQLGVDRWLAVLAAFQLVKGACIVIDCGTACTIDLVAENGQHKGGYIVPGIKMMSDTLYQNTEGVKKPPTTYHDILTAPGRSTDEAVKAGLSAMIIGLIDCILRENNSLNNNNVSILLTGGDGKQFQQILADRLGLNVEFRAELVLDGLQYAEMDSIIRTVGLKS